jgi:DNA-binding IclR family transcriptional regulator
MNSPIDNQARPSGPRVRPVPAVSRAVAILRLLGRNAAPMPLKAIASELDMISSTCLHILRVLVDEGLVKVEAGTKQYTLGVGMLALARNVIERNPFPSLVQPVLDKIAAQWGVTAIGVEVNGVDHMVVLALARSHAPFSLHVDVGSRFPALLSATGRLVAAFTDLPDKEIERRFKALRWDQPPDMKAWRAEVQSVRRDGFSIDRNNYISGIVVIAVPVFDSKQRMTHSIVGAGVADRLSDEQSSLLASELLSEARALSQLLATRR